MRVDRVKLIAEMARQNIHIKELAEKALVSRVTITAHARRQELQRQQCKTCRAGFRRFIGKPAGR